MKLDSFTALVAISSAFLGASAGPVAAKRQASSSTSGGSSTPSSSPTPTSTSSSSSNTQISEGLVPTTLSDGTVTTTAVRDPQFTETTTSSETTTYTFSRTNLPVPASTNFPKCRDANAKPFCLPNNDTPVYVGKTYYATWNPSFFPSNSTVQIKLQWTNDSKVETWSSGNLTNQQGYVAVQVEKDWLEGFDKYNHTFVAVNFGSDNKKAEAFDGPMVTVGNAPAEHYPPSRPNSFNKEGVMIGLPATFGFILLVVLGLWFGMRKKRAIGIGNIMGRRRGYGAGQSRRQRLGIGKTGAIRLEERDASRAPLADPRRHSRGDSLGSLVSDDGRPAPGTNHFRDEIQRQQTGR